MQQFVENKYIDSALFLSMSQNSLKKSLTLFQQMQIN